MAMAEQQPSPETSVNASGATSSYELGLSLGVPASPDSDADELILAQHVAEQAVPIAPEKVAAVVGEKLTPLAFQQLAGVKQGISYVKVVVERGLTPVVHFINDAAYALHAPYVAENILHSSVEDVLRNIDDFNHQYYRAPDRKLLFGSISRVRNLESVVFALETVDVDLMSIDLLREFFQIVRQSLDPSMLLVVKPANHSQEFEVRKISTDELPRVFESDLFRESDYFVLNPGETQGRLRLFRSELEYRAARDQLQETDIVVMPRVPDDIPRVAGMIQALFTTPLSHTNVLATGWGAPNCVQKHIFDRVDQEQLANAWVNMQVAPNGTSVALNRLPEPQGIPGRPERLVRQVHLEVPDIDRDPIVALRELRAWDRVRYGTKASNLGELRYVLENGSYRWFGYYQVNRPPRADLMRYLRNKFEVDTNVELNAAVQRFAAKKFLVPPGIALPFSYQRRFLESSPAIQQGIGALKIALELKSHRIDEIARDLQSKIRKTRIPSSLMESIDRALVNECSGVKTFVVRSSSNAEDLDGFSAAGIYESVNHLTSNERIFDAVREVWASLLSPRSVRLRDQAGISLEQAYMGVLIQEEVSTQVGGVLVTKNPIDSKDFRHVYMNASKRNVTDIVQGHGLPLQYLFNTVEGGGHTLSFGDYNEDLSLPVLGQLQDLAFMGRLLQSHFSDDYIYGQAMDIEWVIHGSMIYLLQIRPYAQI